MSMGRTLAAARLVSVGTALSRVLGLVRNMMMAALFGTSMAQSAFVIAFRIPNLFRRIFGEGALSAAFVPVFAETLEKEGRDQANRLAGRVLTLLGATLSVLVAGGMLLVLTVRHGVAADSEAALFLALLAILLPYMFFICLAALCMAMLNTVRHFFIPAFTPLILNGVWIGVLALVCPWFGERPEERIYAVAWAILAGGALQLLVQLPALRAFGLRPPLLWDLRDRALRRILAAMGPVALGMGVFQINVLMDNLLALWVGAWAPAALSFAEMIVYLPLGIFGTALGTVLLPTFSRQVAQGARQDLGETLGTALSRLVMVLAPAAAGLMALAGPIVQLLYEWPGREFDALSTLQTARALAFYAPGLIFFGAVKVLRPAFYAWRDTRTPVRIGLGAVALNFVLNVTFILTWPAEFKHAGLAMATGLASAANCAVLGWLLQRRIGIGSWRRMFQSAGTSLAGAALMGVAVHGVHARLAGRVEMWGLNQKPGQAVAVGGAILAGMALYGAWLWIARRARAG